MGHVAALWQWTYKSIAAAAYLVNEKRGKLSKQVFLDCTGYHRGRSGYAGFEPDP